ncbi:capsid protein [Blackfly DNA Virus 6]|uniref:Capsid protein n=1 Tax=Blackfly DNA Virus 6 TaxID=2586186 RepID=A0A4Y5QKU3_9VIRU|nr:capsid protein [Blackfly DNA Virus 6]
MSWLQYFKSTGPYLPYVVATPISMAYKRRTRMRATMTRRVRRRVTRRARPTRRSNLARFKRRQRMAIGVSPSDRNKTHTSLVSVKSANGRNTNPIATLALYGADATRIDKMSGTFNRSDRFFQQVDYRGLRYEFAIRNALPDPVIFNYAVISFKNATYTLEDTTYPAEPYQAPGLASDGFFRFNGDSRDENFDNSLAAIAINYAPISTDQYNIHMHKRVLLGPRPVGSDWNHQINTFRHIKGYVPIKRTLRYNDDTDTKCENPIWVVYWINPFHSDSGAAKILQACYVQQFHVAYFKQVV